MSDYVGNVKILRTDRAVLREQLPPVSDEDLARAALRYAVATYGFQYRLPHYTPPDAPCSTANSE